MRFKKITEAFYLAFVVYREARGTSKEAQIAVAYSVLDRVANPRWWGHSIDEVVTKRWQYSSLTDPRDPQLSWSWPTMKTPAWSTCFDSAMCAKNGTVPNPMPGADSYYDVSVFEPKWARATGVIKVGEIGRLIFFNTKGA